MRLQEVSDRVLGARGLRERAAGGPLPRAELPVTGAVRSDGPVRLDLDHEDAGARHEDDEVRLALGLLGVASELEGVQDGPPLRESHRSLERVEERALTRRSLLAHAVGDHPCHESRLCR